MLENLWVFIITSEYNIMTNDLRTIFRNPFVSTIALLTSQFYLDDSIIYISWYLYNSTTHTLDTVLAIYSVFLVFEIWTLLLSNS